LVAEVPVDEERSEDLLSDEGIRFVARLRPDCSPVVGQRITLSIAFERLYFFDLDTGVSIPVG